MTDHIDVPLLANGDWIDAAWLNQYLGDNMRAWQQGFVTGGDVPYALDGNTLAALNKPSSVDSFFKMQTSGVPLYVPQTQLPGALHASAVNFSDSGPSTTSTSYVAVGSGIGFNLSLAVPCTIVAWAFGVGRKNSASHDGYFSIMINGTIDPNENVSLRNTLDTPFGTMYRATAVPAGTRAVSLRYRTGNASDALICTRAAIYAMAFVDP